MCSDLRLVGNSLGYSFDLSVAVPIVVSIQIHNPDSIKAADVKKGEHLCDWDCGVFGVVVRVKP